MPQWSVPEMYVRMRPRLESPYAARANVAVLRNLVCWRVRF
jgi:hypothetical protein